MNNTAPVFKVAIIGNANVGKTTIFNKLSDSSQKVGNWHGVTVEKSKGTFTHNNKTIEVVDLPGIYSLVDSKSKTSDELISQKFLYQLDYDFIINVIDATEVEKQLYLTTELRELNIPTLIVINMADKAHIRGVKINCELLEAKFKSDVVLINAQNKFDIKKLKNAITNFTFSKHKKISIYPKDLSFKLSKLIKLIKAKYNYCDKEALNLLESKKEEKNLSVEIRNLKKSIETEYDESLKSILTSFRYEFVNKVAKEAIFATPRNLTCEAKYDKVLTHPIFGTAILFFIVYLMFASSVMLGNIFIDFFEIFAQAIFVTGTAEFLKLLMLPQLVIDLVANGIGGGIATIAVFIPVITCFSIYQVILEESGYLPRAAILLDKNFNKIGLSGKAFIPLLIGFGCNVPAVMATRTLNLAREKTIAIMMAPFISCSGRLSVFTVFCSVFFKNNAGNVVFFLYLIGIIVSITCAIILNKTLPKSTNESQSVKLTAYNLPTFKETLTSAFSKVADFVKNSGKVIIATFFILHVLASIGMDGSYVNDNKISMIRLLGKNITTIMKPIGINEENWPATISIISGIFAKEVLIGSLNSLYGVEDSNSTVEKNTISKIKDAFTALKQNCWNLIKPSSNNTNSNALQESVFAAKFDGKIGAFAYLLFILLYFPCISVFAVVAQELNFKWATFMVFWSTGLAYFISTTFYQGANLYLASNKFNLLFFEMGILGTGFFLYLLRVIARKIYANN